MRRILRVLAIGFAVLAVLFGVLWAIVSSSWTEDRVRRLLVERLGQELGGPVEIAELSLRLVRAEAQVRGLALRRGTGLVGEFAVREGTLRLSRRALLAGLVRPVRIEVDGLSIALAETPPDGAPEKPLDLSFLSRLRRLRVSDGAFHYRGQEARFAFDIDGIEIDGTPLRNGTSGTLAAGPARIERPGAAPLVVPRVAARFAWRAPRLDLEGIELEALESTLGGSASVAFLPQGVAASVDARGAATLEALLGEVVPELTGRITFDGGFRLEEDGRWTGRARLASDGIVRFRRAEVAKLEALLLADPEAIRIVEGRANSPSGTTVEHLEVSVRDGVIEAGADGNLETTDIFPSLGLPRDLVLGAGPYKARLWRAAAGQPLRWRVEASPVPPAGAANALDGRFTGEGGGGRIALDFDGAWGRSGLTFRLRGDDAVLLDGLTIEAALDAPDAASARAALGHLLTQGREIDLELPLETTPVPDGPMAVDARVGLVAGKLTGLDTTVELEGVLLGQARFERYRGHFVEVARNRWSLAMEATDAAGGAVEADLEISPGNHLGIRASAGEADYDAVTEIVRAIGIELGLPEGRGLVSGSIQGEWSSTAAELAFDATAELTVGDATPARLAGRGRLTNDAVRIDEGLLALPGLEARFAGDVALPSGTRPLAAALRSSLTVDLAPFFSVMRGRSPISAPRCASRAISTAPCRPTCRLSRRSPITLLPHGRAWARRAARWACATKRSPPSSARSRWIPTTGSPCSRSARSAGPRARWTRRLTCSPPRCVRAHAKRAPGCSLRGRSRSATISMR